MTENKLETSKISRRDFLTKHSRGLAAAAIGAGIAGSILSSEVPRGYAANITGSGTVGIIPKWDATTDITNSNYSDNGTALLPASDNSFDLGASSQRWRNAYMLDILSGTSDLVLNPNSAVLPPGNSTKDIGSVSLGWRNAYLGGTLNLGTGIGWATLHGHNFGGVGGIQMGGVGNILAPETDNIIDLGTASQRWRNVNASGTVTSAGTSTLSRSTPSRSIDIVYRNTTGKNLFVSIVCDLASGSHAWLFSDSSNNPTTVVSEFGGVNTPPLAFTMTTVVAPNDYYRVYAPYGGVTLDHWIEWTF